MKKIGFFSTGIPDPNQGGSGIFNYHILKRLIDKGYLIDSFFRVSKSFIENNTNSKFLNTIKNNLNSINFIYEDDIKIKKINFFFNHLSEIHYFNKSIEVVKNLSINYDSYISLDLGWAIALSQKKNCVSILGDPYHSRVIHGDDTNIFSLKKNFLKFRALSTSTKMVMKKINNHFEKNDKILLGSFSKQHAEEYSKKGLNCKEIDWFSPYVDETKTKKNYLINEIFTLTHIGDLGTTASRKNLNFLLSCLKILSQKINSKIKIKFIGRYKKKLISPFKNIEFEYTGYLENLDNEINSSDAMISVSDYPVGTRTRILSSLSYGLPCIAHISSALGLHRLKHEEHILFCHDKMSFVECVEKLMNVNGLPEKIGKKSRDLWLKYYNPLINVDKILKIVNC